MAGPRQTWARDAETDGGEAAKPVQGSKADPEYADISHSTRRTPEPANTPIPGARNRYEDGCFTSWNGAAGGPQPEEPEIEPQAP